MVKGKLNLQVNTRFVLKDKSGKLKKLFSPNKLAIYLLKRGLIKPTFVKIPFLLGNWRDSMRMANLITDAGLAGIASRINGSGAAAAFTYIAVGTGTNAAAVTDTTLQTETTDSGLGRAAGTASLTTTNETNDTASLTKTFTVTGTKAITESGVLNASSAGTLLARQVFSAINVQNGDVLQVDWDIVTTAV